MSARWLLAYNPDAERAILRLRVNGTLWHERAEWAALGNRSACILDVTEQLPRVLAELLARGVQDPARSSDIPLGFVVQSQRLVVGHPDAIPVDTHNELRAALACRHAGRVFVGCG